MKLESYSRRAPWINLSALIDVLFILLVFVMLAATFEQTRALEVQVPSADTKTPLRVSTLLVVVTVDGTIRVEGRAVPRADLPAVLRDARKRSDELAIVADRRLPLEVATDILSVATRAGFEAVSIATRPARSGR